MNKGSQVKFLMKVGGSALISLMLAGCGEKTVAGEVFVVTKGRQTVRLSLVDVKFFAKKIFDPHLKEKQEEWFKNYAVAVEALTKANLEATESTRKYNVAFPDNSLSKALSSGGGKTMAALEMAGGHLLALKTATDAAAVVQGTMLDYPAERLLSFP